MRVFKVNKDLSLTGADLLAMIMKDDKAVHMHPIISDLLEYNVLKSQLSNIQTSIAIEICSKILRAVSSIYLVEKMLEEPLDFI